MPTTRNTGDLSQRLRAAAAVCLLLDYDGALVEPAPQPRLPAPDQELLALLSALGSLRSLQVHVMSRGSQKDLLAWLGHLPVVLHAEHGLFSRLLGESDWERFPIQVPPMPSRLLAALFWACEAIPGSFVERKQSAVAWHYRLAPEQRVKRLLPSVERRVFQGLDGSGFRMLCGSRVIEIVPEQLSKSTIARTLFKRFGRALPVAIGCDVVDEDVFEVVNEHGISVRVGNGPTCAWYRLPGVPEVRAVLCSLLGDSPACASF